VKYVVDSELVPYKVIAPHSKDQRKAAAKQSALIPHCSHVSCAVDLLHNANKQTKHLEAVHNAWCVFSP